MAINYLIVGFLMTIMGAVLWIKHYDPIKNRGFFGLLCGWLLTAVGVITALYGFVLL